MGQKQNQVASEYSVADSWSFTSAISWLSNLDVTTKLRHKGNFERETFTHRWNISNFKDVLDVIKKGGSLRSNTFIGGKTTKHTWRLSLQKKTVDEVDYLGIFLNLDAIGKNNGGKTLMASEEFSILDENNKPIRQLGGSGSSNNFMDIDSKEPKTTAWGYNSFLKISHLMDGSKNYLVQDELKIHCRIWVNVALKTYETPNQTSAVSLTLDTPPLKQLGAAYKKMLKNSIHHDVVIKTSTKEFKIHKAVLAVRSPVFAAMLETEMQETKSGIISISDFSDNIIQEMLNFMYSGEVENMKENIAELFAIADKYDFEELKNECIRNIPSALTCENAVAIYLTIIRHNLPELKPIVVQYMARNIDCVKNTTVLSEEIKELLSAFL